MSEQIPASRERPPQPPRRPSRLRRFGRRLLYLLLILVAVHLIATAVTGLMLSRELNRLRASGELQTLPELAPKVPAGQRNAAEVYQQAFDSLRLSKEETDALDLVASGAPPATPEQAPTSEQRLLARRALANNTRYFALLDEASRIPACAFPVKWAGNPLDMLFPHLARLRWAARLLAVRGRFAREDRRTDDSVRDFLTTLRIQQHVLQEPTVIAALVAGSIHDIAARELPRTFSAGDPSPDLLRQLQAQVQVLRGVPMADAALRGERAFGQAIFTEARSGKLASLDITGSGEATPPWQRLALALYPTLGRPLLNLDHLARLRFDADAAAAAGLPYPESLNGIRAAHARLDETPGYRAFLARTTGALLLRPFMVFAMHDASLGLTWYAAQLKLYRYQYGRYPGTLSDLPNPPASLSLDPFSQQPYHYRVEGAGFRLWSVGDNGVDDGGSDKLPETRPGGPKRPHRLYGPLDIVVRVTR